MNNNVEVAKETMTGDFRDALLTAVRNLPDVWQKMSEARQQEFIDWAEKTSKEMVAKAVRILVKSGRETIPVKISNYKVGAKEITLSITANTDEDDKLVGTVNKMALLVTDSTDEYVGERAKAVPDKDQRDMFNNCNREYQEEDGEGVPDPIVVNDENEQLALPAPDKEEIDENEYEDFEDVTDEEITEGNEPKAPSSDEEENLENDEEEETEEDISKDDEENLDEDLAA